MTAPPLVVHVIHALGVGGLENGIVNLINHMPAHRYRHAIVCMTHATEFRQRIRRSGVEVVAMNRGAQPLWRTYAELVKVFRRMRPAVVHSRNLSGLDALLPAMFAGVGVRIHGEHGRDADDLDGLNPRNLRLRRIFRPFVRHYCAVSKDLQRYLTDTVGAPAARVSQIYNGVDTEIFAPRVPDVESAGARPAGLVIGTVGRLNPVKDQRTLIRAFAQARRMRPEAMASSRLVIVGEGPNRRELEEETARADLRAHVDLVGERSDVAPLLRSFDIFVLPSLVEGISNTILEAMASGLPVVATRVGGNAELIDEGRTGKLVCAGDPRELAAALVEYAGDAALRSRHGRAARAKAQNEFSMHAMVEAYLTLYDSLLSARTPAQPDALSSR